MRVIYDLPNPFMQVSVLAGPGGADREAAALEPISTPGGVAAEPVGYRCCDDCGYRDPCDQHCPQIERSTASIASRFQLDEAALMSDIEPVPAFISRRTTAEEIEELLELARAEEWPAPPRRMVG